MEVLPLGSQRAALGDLQIDQDFKILLVISLALSLIGNQVLVYSLGNQSLN